MTGAQGLPDGSWREDETEEEDFLTSSVVMLLDEIGARPGNSSAVKPQNGAIVTPLLSCLVTAIWSGMLLVSSRCSPDCIIREAGVLLDRNIFRLSSGVGRAIRKQ